MGYVEINGRIFGPPGNIATKVHAIAQEAAAILRRHQVSALIESPEGLTLHGDGYTVVVGHHDARVVVTALWPGMSARVGTMDETIPARQAAAAIVHLLDPREVRRRLLLEQDKKAFNAFNYRMRKVAA